MTKRLLILTVLFFTVGFFSIGQVNKHNINVVDFHSISVNSSYTVHVKQSNKQEVRVEALKEIYDISEFVVKEGVLHINIEREETKSNSSIWQKIDNIKIMPTLNVYVSMKDIKNLSVNGNGKLITENSLAADHLNILVAGTGSLEADIKCKTLAVKLAGPGTLKLKGYADSMEVDNSGAGTIDAFECEIQTAQAKHYGLGATKINISDKLDAQVYGSGSILVKGATKEIIKKEYGVGKVERTN